MPTPCLEQFLHHLEKSHLYLSIDNTKQAKKECLESIKILNSIAKTTPLPEIKVLSQYTLNHYESLDKPRTISDKLEWISSKLTQETFFPPVIQFNENFTSHNELFVDTISPIQDNDNKIFEKLPNKLAKFEYIEILNWDNDITHLKNLYQDILPNCSFVSSFLAIIDANIPIIDTITPQKSSQKYKVSLRFNGALRNVIVDSKFPIMPNLRNLIIKSYSDTELYWPALIEKAYLTIMGNGYNFSGSNMANDAYVLSGWLPQIIKLSNGQLPSNIDDLWRLRTQGKVTMGIGTGTLSKQLSSQLHLVSGHDYVIDNIKDGVITVKNPWLDPKDRVVEIKNFNHFKYLYVNWKPDHKPYQHHFLYQAKPNTYNQPQFTIKCMEETWILLERHLSETLLLPLPHWMDMNVYETEYKIITPLQYKKYLSVETNNRLQLIKLKPGVFTIVISSNKPCRFTLSSFNAMFSKLKYKYDYTETVNGEWNSDINGGNWAMSTYINNPQYDIIAKQTTELIMGMHGQGQINFHLFHSSSDSMGERIQNFDKTKLINYQNYNASYQSLSYRLTPGHYKLVVSEYYRSIGTYQLVLNSSEPITITKIPPFLGLYNISKSFNWDNTNRFKLKFETTGYNSKVKIKIAYFNGESDFELQTSYRPAMRASLFNSQTKQPIQINEQFNDSLYGVFLHEILPLPEEYILLIERFEIGYGRCVVEIGCNNKVILK